MDIVKLEELLAAGHDSAMLRFGLGKTHFVGKMEHFLDLLKGFFGFNRKLDFKPIAFPVFISF